MDSVDLGNGLAEKERYYRFVMSPLGVAFTRFENATIAYWQSAMLEKISERQDERYKNARRELLRLLMADTP